MAEKEEDTTSSGDKYNTVFIDTNLDTHLAIIVSHTDTVLHLKQKIMKEHPKCFPELGKIKINALKMKQKGIFYHLSEEVLVNIAFRWSKKCWFLSVDMSTEVQPNEIQKPNNTDVTNQLALICFAKTSGDSYNHQANNSSNKIVNNCGPGYSSNEPQKDLQMEFKNVTADDSSRVCSDLNGAFDYKSKLQENLCEGLVVSEINAKLQGVDSQVEIDKNSSDKPVRQVPVDVVMVNTDAVEGPCSASLDDTDLRFLKTAVPTKNDESKDLVCDAPPENAQNSIPALKKRKRKKNTLADNPQEEDYNKTPKGNDLPKSFVELVTDISSKRSKKKNPRDQEVFADPPSSHIMDKVSNSAVVSKSDSQLAVSSSTIGMDLMESDIATAKVQTVAPELGPKRGSKVTKRPKNRNSTNLNELPPPVVSELGSMKENPVLSVGEDFVREDDGIKIYGPEIVKEQKDSVHNRVTEKEVLKKSEQLVQSGIEGSPYVAETIKNVEHGKFPRGTRLKKTAKKPVSPKVVSSSAEDSNNSVKEFPTIAPHDLSVEAIKFKSPLSQINISEPTLLNTCLVEANIEGNNRLNKSEEESRESEELAHKNYGVEAETNSRVEEKETRIDFPRVKSTRKTTGVPAAKQRQKKRSEKKSQDNEEIASNILEKETDRNIRVKGKLNKSDTAQQLIADITTKDTGVSAAKPSKKTKKIQSSTGETHSALPIKDQNLGNEELFISKNGTKEAKEASKIGKLRKSSSKNLPTGKNLELKKNVGDEHGSIKRHIEHKDANISTLGAKKEIEEKSSLVNNRSTIAKLSSKRMGAVVNSLPREKSLMATPASIFRDESSDSSEYSDTSTKAPSYNSSSSSDSDEEGADSARGANFTRSKKESETPHQRIDMDMILRNSSRFKQAKLSAVKYLHEDTESQPVDFVLESKPI